MSATSARIEAEADQASVQPSAEPGRSEGSGGRDALHHFQLSGSSFRQIRMQNLFAPMNWCHSLTCSSLPLRSECISGRGVEDHAVGRVNARKGVGEDDGADLRNRPDPEQSVSWSRLERKKAA